MDDIHQQHESIFCRYGRAMYHAQCLEVQIKITLGILYNPTFNRQNEAERIAYFARFDGYTLGRLFHLFCRRTTPPESVTRALDSVRGIRNELAHSFFWENRALLGSKHGDEALLKYLGNVIHDLTVVDDYFCAMANTWLAKRGDSPFISNRRRG